MSPLCADTQDVVYDRQDVQLASSLGAPGLQERLRTQTLARYFTPAQITADSIKSASGDPVPPTLSTSTHLTGLAQIGALRLSCDRAFVSLLDTSTQYIVAEATRTISLRKSDRHSSPQDALFLGVQALHKSYGVCPNTVQVFTDDTGKSAINTDEVVANASRYIIRDFRNLDAYKNKPYVVGFPHMRSYAEVPMKSSNGRVIGSYCVVDTEVRDDFFHDDTIFVLAEIADSLVEYLDLVNTKHNHERGEKLMEGLSLFAEGRSSLNAESDGDKHYMKPSNQQGSSNDLSTPADSDAPSPLPRNLSNLTGDSSDGTSTLDDLKSASEYRTPLTTPSDGPNFDEAFGDAAMNRKSSISSESCTTSTAQYGATFSRAANLIREALDLNGIAFLDTSLDGTSDSISLDRDRYDSINQKVMDSIQEVPQKELASDPNQEAYVTTQSKGPSPLCHILGSSSESSIDSSIRHPEGAPSAISEASLRYLATEYPDGHIFTSDEHGGLLPAREPSHVTGEKNSGKERRGSTERSLPSEISKAFSMARSVIFLPLWDFSKGKFFAALLGWTNDPTRVLKNDDFVCLSAFGDAVMTEMARLEAVDVANAKSNFISSVSHELRSPLHGILASAELLNGVVEDESQIEMIRMIESCGTTLLDTLNHLLDFSSINHFDNAKGHVRRARSRSDAPSNDVYGHVSDANLSELVQNVVEGVHFGQTSRDVATRSLTTQANMLDGISNSSLYHHSGTYESSRQPASFEANHVAVIVDIENRPNWKMQLQVGAWKRIVMNLFANALKYTHHGHIEISLRLLCGQDNTKPDLDYAQFTISDTGIGMSSEYQKHQLFKPFSQENPLANGTGLGLSIVKQIVDNLHGKITIRSKPGSGTRIVVNIPVDTHAAQGTLPSLTAQPHVLDPTGILRGRTLCLISDAGSVEHDGNYRRASTPDNTTLLTMWEILGRLAKEWFGMRIIHSNCLDDASADFYLVSPAIIGTASDARHSRPRRIISVGAQIKDRIAVRNSGDSTITSLPYPLGPRTFSKALLTTLKTAEEDDTPPGTPDPDTNFQQGHSANNLKEQHSFSTRKADSTDASAQTLNCNKHLLLVDDNVINLKILRSYVTRLGCTSVTAENGFDAVSRYISSEKPFDIVFMDISMPVMNGFDASRRIREFERENAARITQPTRIIALTGLGSEESRQEALISGIDEFRTKPVPLHELKLILEET